MKGRIKMYTIGIINALVTKGINKAEATLAVNAFTKIISDTLAAGESVKIRGFGKLCVRHRDSYTTRHLYTGEPLHVPAYRSIVFVPGKQLKKTVNK